jgi:hypothetical protein
MLPPPRGGGGGPFICLEGREGGGRGCLCYFITRL